MPQVCGVCRLPNRHQAEEALLAGEPLRNVAKRFGTSSTALYRHKEAHLPAKLIKAAESREIDSAESLTAKLQAIETEARRLGQKAEKAGDTRTALVAIRELVRLIELAARIQAARQQVSGGQNVEFSPETRRKVVFKLSALYYSEDPAAFLEAIREAAAENYNSYRLADQPALTRAEARAMYEARERLQPGISVEIVEGL